MFQFGVQAEKNVLNRADCPFFSGIFENLSLTPLHGEQIGRQAAVAESGLSFSAENEVFRCEPATFPHTDA